MTSWTSASRLEFSSASAISATERSSPSSGNTFTSSSSIASALGSPVDSIGCSATSAIILIVYKK